MAHEGFPLPGICACHPAAILLFRQLFSKHQSHPSQALADSENTPHPRTKGDSRCLSTARTWASSSA